MNWIINEKKNYSVTAGKTLPMFHEKLHKIGCYGIQAEYSTTDT